MKWYNLKILTLSSLLLITIPSSNHLSFSQCAMCKATISNSKSSQKEQQNGFNKAIAYMLAAPYLLISFTILGWLYYSRNYNHKKDRRNKV